VGDLESLVGALAGGGIGIYFVAVVWHGNVSKLGHMLMGEEGYLEFLVALMLLGLVNKYGPQGKITSAITTMAIIAVMVKIGANTNLNQALAKFSTGQASALDTIKELMQGS
jgi:hypothetical protein